MTTWVKARDPFTAIMEVAEHSNRRPEVAGVVCGLLMEYEDFSTFAKGLEELAGITLEHNTLLPGWRAAPKE